MSVDEIIELASEDPYLSEIEKKELATSEAKKRLSSLLAGSTGSLLLLSLARYRNMSKMSQILMAALGFGVGKLIYSEITKPKFSKYDPKTNSYEIDTKRF